MEQKIDIEEIPFSPRTERLHIENKKLQDEWEGCCSRTDKHYLKYISQLIMGGVVMIFSMGQIIRQAPNPEIYFSLLSGTLGLFMPRPSADGGS